MKTWITIFSAALCPLLPMAGTSSDFQSRISAFPLHIPQQLDSAAAFVANKENPPRIREAVEWLYAYMPTADIVNYPFSFHLANVESSFKTRSLTPWGERVPEREFRYFVLPARVNNEALDSARLVFAAELLPRISGMSMTEAALEVNHWCHEKATYRPSDPRTSTPLSTVSQAIGRCGEESTFTVAAMRAVGIPARQVYTPRWAHTDDNHAWVEVWTDGKWHFLGACEPEPVLDLAWFNAPAARGMLMNTRVSGHYDGPEEKIDSTAFTTVINVTGNYAPTDEACVRVTDAAGRPKAGVRVDFCLYNYAMPYPLASRITDAGGCASLTCGMGDLIAWASDGSMLDYGIVRPGKPLTLRLDGDGRGARQFKVTPPPVGGSLPAVSASQRAENDRKLSLEDSIRSAYTSGFADSLSAAAKALELGLEPARLVPLLIKSRGNHERILNWLKRTESRMLALRLLEHLEEKDLRDADPAVLAAHIRSFGSVEPSDFEIAYLLQPRIEWEHLTPWRSELKRMVSPEILDSLRSDPSLVWEVISRHTASDNGLSARGAVIAPEAAWRNGVADQRSARILAVALLRTAGIPSRLDPVSGVLQALFPGANEGEWRQIPVQTAVGVADSPTGLVPVTFSYCNNGVVTQPKYWSHFTLSSLRNGFPDTYDFGDFSTVDEINAVGHTIESGPYLLMSGQRMADGSVLVQSEILNIDPGHSVLAVTMPKDTAAIQVLGSFDSESLYYDPREARERSLLSTTGRGYYTLVLAAPGHEPTAHVLNEICALAGEFEKDGRTIALMFRNEAEAARFDRSLFGRMPSNLVTGIDTTGKIHQALAEDLEMPAGDMPLIIVADTFNRVVLRRHGYTVGTGEALLSTLRQLE